MAKTLSEISHEALRRQLLLACEIPVMHLAWLQTNARAMIMLCLANAPQGRCCSETLSERLSEAIL